MDSLGRNGFRIKNYSFIKSTRTWVIHGLTLKGYTKSRLISLLGPSTSSGLGKEDRLLIMTYVVQQQGKSRPEKSLIIYFDKNNRVEDIVEETGMPK